MLLSITCNISTNKASILFAKLNKKVLYGNYPKKSPILIIVIHTYFFKNIFNPLKILKYIKKYYASPRYLGPITYFSSKFNLDQNLIKCLKCYLRPLHFFLSILIKKS